MSETAMRAGYGHHSDVVRRLIARPIRLQAVQAAKVPQRPVMVLAVAPVTEIEVSQESEPPQAIEPAQATEPVEATAPVQAIEPAQTEVTIVPAVDTDRIQIELVLMKAVLQAERRENASLRARFGFDEAEETLGEEARVIRDRWASLVDRLLNAAA